MWAIINNYYGYLYEYLLFNSRQNCKNFFVEKKLNSTEYRIAYLEIFDED